MESTLLTAHTGLSQAPVPSGRSPAAGWSYLKSVSGSKKGFSSPWPLKLGQMDLH